MLTNGPPPQSAALLERAGLASSSGGCRSVDAGGCKPRPNAYCYVVDSCGVPLQRCAMVAVHRWDLHGAAAVGMTTGPINRLATPWPPVCTPPTVTSRTLGHLALGLVGR